MPVTAKLSSKFYEKFGDEATNELVEWFNQVDAAYRSDLRDFNEINFERFDSKLRERLSQFEAGVGRRLAELDQKIETRTLSLRAEIGKEVAQAKTEMVRWMFGFWVTTVGMIFLARLI